MNDTPQQLNGSQPSAENQKQTFSLANYLSAYNIIEELPPSPEGITRVWISVSKRITANEALAKIMDNVHHLNIQVI